MEKLKRKMLTRWTAAATAIAGIEVATDIHYLPPLSLILKFPWLVYMLV